LGNTPVPGRLALLMWLIPRIQHVRIVSELLITECEKP